MPGLKLTDRSKAGVMAYFQTIIKNKQVIVGQQCSETADMALNYRKSFQSLFDSTGKYPALLGLEYGYFPGIDLIATNQYAINHWNKGGLVTISWHADCPWTDGYNVRWNSAKNKTVIDVNKLLKNAPASKEKANYRTELSKIAAALKQLKDKGVIVLWRPFHEVNGTWFWWGVNDQSVPSNQKDYQALWQDMYRAFTIDYALNNLIWIYSPFTPLGNAPLGSMYPGDNFVDMVAVDSYPITPEFNDYDSLRKFKKLVINGEVGPAKAAFGNFDEMAVLNIFKGRAAYFLQWHSWNNAKVAIVDNLKYKEMMNDPAAITLDKIK
ncbi:MAG: hypothetical protein H7Z13_11160 [Ferruginibacter sp.]|nr:hypothetical protein [Ferruginibacter sp.]